MKLLKPIVINSNGSPYLRRYVLLRIGSRFQLYLHHFVGGDLEEELHDHPWCGLFAVLRGSYLEELFANNKRCLRWVRRVNWIPAKRIHRIKAVKDNTWTLGVVWRVRKHWHFYSYDPSAEGCLVQTRSGVSPK